MSRGSPFKRNSAIHRAKEAYKLFVTHGIVTTGFKLYEKDALGRPDSHYKYFDFETKYCVELKNNGALRKAFL